MTAWFQLWTFGQTLISIFSYPISCWLNKNLVFDNISRVTFCFPLTNRVWICWAHNKSLARLHSSGFQWWRHFYCQNNSWNGKEAAISEHFFLVWPSIKALWSKNHDHTHSFSLPHTQTHIHCNSLPAEAIIHYAARSLEVAAIQAHSQLSSL